MIAPCVMLYRSIAGAEICMGKSVSTMIERRVAELMFAHVCHELTGPVTAINNGFELVEAGDPVPQDVRDLLVRSAKTGAQRLRIYRTASGWRSLHASLGVNYSVALQ